VPSNEVKCTDSASTCTKNLLAAGLRPAGRTTASAPPDSLMGFCGGAYWDNWAGRAVALGERSLYKEGMRGEIAPQ